MLPVPSQSSEPEPDRKAAEELGHHVAFDRKWRESEEAENGHLENLASSAGTH